VRRIQQYARLRPDEAFVVVDPNQIVEEALKITQPRWEEMITQEHRPLQLRRGLGPVALISGRPAALTEVMTNLILNAFDAMPDGGTLSISTGLAPGGDVLVTVADTGVGMSDAVSRRIFEPFFSTKGEAGSGLGLAMAYSIVKRHGGDIRVESAPGRGATFTLTFPPGTPSRPSAMARPAPASVRRHARVLVVDDDPQVLATFEDLLESFGHATTAASTGAAGLEAYARERFDVVVADVGMPVVSGWEFAERLRAVDPRVALVFVTGWGLREEDTARLDALGVKHCLYKPVKPAELDAAIQAILRAT
jgi:CheY-like chemotaxis protein/anti-sigma regulatory factor (Ser/Thr protein kinase)